MPQDAGEDVEAWTWLTVEEIAQLLGSWKVPEPARLLYQTAIYTGLRAGELWALRWERIRLHGSAPQIVVAKSNRRKSTKSGKVRAVPLLEQAQEALREWHGLRGEPIEGLVFPGTDGRQRPCGDDHGWADRRRGKQGIQLGHRSIAGIRDGVRFHDLRHTCASHLLQGTWGREWTLEEVRDFLGHSSIVVTQKYAHLGAKRLHEAAAATSGHRPGIIGVTPEKNGGLSEPSKPNVAGSRPAGRANDNRPAEQSHPLPGSVPGEQAQNLLNLVAAGQDVPRGLILRVAAAALAVLPDAAELAALAVGGGDQALGAAVILAGKLRKAGAG